MTTVSSGYSIIETHILKFESKTEVLDEEKFGKGEKGRREMIKEITQGHNYRVEGLYWWKFY